MFYYCEYSIITRRIWEVGNVKNARNYPKDSEIFLNPLSPHFSSFYFYSWHQYRTIIYIIQLNSTISYFKYVLSAAFAVASINNNSCTFLESFTFSSWAFISFFAVRTLNIIPTFIIFDPFFKNIQYIYRCFKTIFSFGIFNIKMYSFKYAFLSLANHLLHSCTTASFISLRIFSFSETTLSISSQLKFYTKTQKNLCTV